MPTRHWENHELLTFKECKSSKEHRCSFFNLYFISPITSLLNPHILRSNVFIYKNSFCNDWIKAAYFVDGPSIQKTVCYTQQQNSLAGDRKLMNRGKKMVVEPEDNLHFMANTKVALFHHGIQTPESHPVVHLWLYQTCDGHPFYPVFEMFFVF